MGGTHERFDRTPWSRIHRVQQGEPGQDIKGELIRVYWKPVYCFLRRRGYANEPAKDLTQGFFQESILEGDLLNRADSQQGRFRNLLLTALDQYLHRQHRKQTTRKRRPNGTLMSLDTLEAHEWQAITALTPEQAFHYAWASELLEEVLTRLRAEYTASGKPAHWQVFAQRVLEPLLRGAPAPTLGSLCAQYGLRSEAQASNMIVTVKRRFQSLLMRRLSELAGPEADVEAEIAHLIEVLSHAPAG